MYVRSFVKSGSGINRLPDAADGNEKTNKAKLKKVCGSTNMDIFFTGGRAVFFFFNIFFSTCKYTVYAYRVDSTTSTRQQSYHSLHCTAVQLQVQVKSKRSRLRPQTHAAQHVDVDVFSPRTYVSHTTARRKKVTVGLKLYGRSGESNHTPSLVWPNNIISFSFPSAASGSRFIIITIPVHTCICIVILLFSVVRASLGTSEGPWFESWW